MVTEPTFGKWQPIDTAPHETGKLIFVLVATEEFSTPDVAAYSEDDKTWVTPDDYFNLQGTPTHWMPLPDPP